MRDSTKFWHSVKKSDSGSLRSFKITKHHFSTPDPPIALKGRSLDKFAVERYRRNFPEIWCFQLIFVKGFQKFPNTMHNIGPVCCFGGFEYATFRPDIKNLNLKFCETRWDTHSYGAGNVFIISTWSWNKWFQQYQIKYYQLYGKIYVNIMCLADNYAV